MSRRTLQLTPEEQAKVDKLRRRREALNIDPEWQFLAEFGYYYGYEGIRAIRNNEIPLEEAQALLLAAHKRWNRKVIDIANATYVASAAAQSKKGKSIMKKGLENYTRNT